MGGLEAHEPHQEMFEQSETSSSAGVSSRRLTGLLLELTCPSSAALPRHSDPPLSRDGNKSPICKLPKLNSLYYKTLPGRLVNLVQLAVAVNH